MLLFTKNEWKKHAEGTNLKFVSFFQFRLKEIFDEYFFTGSPIAKI